MREIEFVLTIIYMMAFITAGVMIGIIYLSIIHPGEPIDQQLIMFVSLIVFLAIHRDGYKFEYNKVNVGRSLTVHESSITLLSKKIDMFMKNVEEEVWINIPDGGAGSRAQVEGQGIQRR